LFESIVDPLEPHRKDAEGAEYPEFHPIFTNNVVIQVRQTKPKKVETRRYQDSEPDERMRKVHCHV
jgi:hypothetical protein